MLHHTYATQKICSNGKKKRVPCVNDNVIPYKKKEDKILYYATKH